MARTYNDWMHDFCSYDTDRMYGAAMASPFDVETTVSEARRGDSDEVFDSSRMLWLAELPIVRTIRETRQDRIERLAAGIPLDSEDPQAIHKLAGEI